MRSPKLAGVRSKDWYRYYAGYTPEFVEDALARLALRQGAHLLDPWNGSGTTTAVAQRRGIAAVGYDVNPALVLIARSRLLGSEVTESIEPLFQELLNHARSFESQDTQEPDPLAAWFHADVSREIRSIERAIRHLLVEHDAQAPLLVTKESIDQVSALAAFFYVALFQAIRAHLKGFVTTNPTWVKTATPEELLFLDAGRIRISFTEAAHQLKERIGESGCANTGFPARVELSSSTALPLGDASIDGAVTSPPYCTRIDYVVAMRPELAVLGMQPQQLRRLRGSMVGTPTILETTPPVAAEWGGTAERLVERVGSHSSHASAGYYKKYFVQYFAALYASLRELRRVMRSGGGAVIVVQDSFYKDIYVDLRRIVTEMCEALGWSLVDEEKFSVSRTKAAIHPSARAWRDSFGATEVALVFS